MVLADCSINLSKMAYKFHSLPNTSGEKVFMHVIITRHFPKQFRDSVPSKTATGKVAWFCFAKKHLQMS